MCSNQEQPQAKATQKIKTAEAAFQPEFRLKRNVANLGSGIWQQRHSGSNSLSASTAEAIQASSKKKKARRKPSRSMNQFLASKSINKLHGFQGFGFSSAHLGWAEHSGDMAPVTGAAAPAAAPTAVTPATAAVAPKAGPAPSSSSSLEDTTSGLNKCYTSQSSRV